MRHKFPKDQPTTSPIHVQCLHCGVEQIRYPKGGVAYYVNGKTTSHAPKCSQAEDIPEPYSILNVAKPQQEKSVVPPPRITPTLPPAEARCKELMVLVQAMYEDMVSHNVRTNSRQMAGRLLHSEGYQEWITYLDTKTA